MVKWPPTPQKIEKNKFVLKCILGHFQYFEPMFFLVENRPIQTPPPLLVENSTNFFFETFPKGGGGGVGPLVENSTIFFFETFPNWWKNKKNKNLLIFPL